MRTREELLKTISSSKKGKLVAIIGIVLSLLGYVYLDDKQVTAEKELMILDQGRIDQTVLE